ncbi:MAG: polysaccharide pyruvyl transferase family protein [Oscillospiraceae bacterium]
MKVLTITFHTAKNYGAVLQCYALQKAITPYVDDARTIDFSTASMRYHFYPKGKGLKKIIKRILISKDVPAIKRKFEKYNTFIRQNIRLTQHYASIEELRTHPPQADCVITGSDQVFNPERRPDERQAYFLDFPSSFKASYAASFGASGISEQRKEELTQYLRQFNQIAMREDYGVSLAGQLTGRSDISHTIDPVFLLSQTEWRTLEEPYEGLPKQYILYFNLRESKTTNDIVKKVSKATGLPIVMITAKPILPFRCQYVLRDVGPQNYLWLIDHCAYLIEDSFHSTAFSIIFEKQFIFCDDHPKSYERGRALLQHLGLAQCYDVTRWKEMIDQPLCYDNARKVIQTDKNQAIQYLLDCFQQAEKNKTPILSKKRIGIITYTDSLNWGAQLQAYALKESFESFDKNLVVNQIDHRPLNLALYRKGKSIKIICNNAVAAMEKKAFDIRAERTRSFRNRFLGLTPPCHTQEQMRQLNAAFDSFVTGSDQVWNCSKGINANFYLDFVDDPNKKCAYAASFGIADLPEQYRQEVAQRLKAFRFISVRETDGQNILQKNCGRLVPTSCDPVFLLRRKQWENIIAQSSQAEIPKKKYIFVYSTDNSLEFIRLVGKIKRKYHLPVISVTGIPGCKVVKDSGPAEFIHLIRDAETVVTTSFHAIAFSIIFQKHFYVMPHHKTGGRVKDLLKRLGIEDRVVRQCSDVNMPAIDFNEVHSRLDLYRQQSIENLKAIVDGMNNRSKDRTIESVHDLCTGCRVCETVCPKQCITMQTDADGFVYPVIDPQTCIQCGICLKKCHVSKNYPKLSADNGCFGYAKKEVLRMEGSSGGAFSALVEVVSKECSVNFRIYGSSYDVENQSVHQQGFTFPDYKPLCKSKYVFSDPENTFLEAKKNLEDGATVLYCGTPCQISALYQSVGTHENLITADFICHGVPSQQFMQAHVSYITGMKQPQTVEFRSKAMGWGLHKYCLKVQKNDGMIYLKKAGCDFFFTHFLRSDCLRLGCYHCCYSNAHQSDITLGDFWEASRYVPAENTEKGLSVVFANSQKGFELLRALHDTMELRDIPFGYHKSHCGCSTKQIAARSAFLRKLRETGIENMEKQFKHQRVVTLLKKALRR